MSTYKEAGVDVKLADAFVERIKPHVKSTHKYWDGEMINGLGGFAAVLKWGNNITGISTDGVGSKACIAAALDDLTTIGIDVVAMNANDVCVVMQPERSIFVDYYAVGRLSLHDGERVIQGIAQGCTLANAALVGGETAEMPLVFGSHKLRFDSSKRVAEDIETPIRYLMHEFDLAGTFVGFAHADATDSAVMKPHFTIKKGMGIFGFRSSGLHSNGYSLVHRVFGIDYNEPNQALKILRTHYGDFDRPLGDILLTPTTIYCDKIRLTRNAYSVAGFAHITGGGLARNIPRILPRNCDARVHPDRWPHQPIFDLIAKTGNVSQSEMLRAFNCGIGLVAVSKQDLTPAGYYYMGDIVPGDGKVEFVR
ncbi:phosphoribosylformylglycinamidine cyclo-ligase [Candidatus Kaiserbacteria bacterium]|nr:phosphoribosylformylglycinamidine cyclo-ligase [Candidatus Kaiserbacteria bacterium]